MNCHLNCGKVLTSKTSKLLGGPSSKQKPKNLKPQNSCIVVAGAENGNLKTSKLLDFCVPSCKSETQNCLNSSDYCDRSSKSKPQNFKTAWIISGPSCKSKFQTLQKLCNYLITVAKSQKLQNPLPGCGPSCKSKHELRNSRIIWSRALHHWELTTKPAIVAPCP